MKNPTMLIAPAGSLFGTIGWLRKKVYSGLIRLVPMLLRFEKRDSLSRLGALCHAKLSVSVLSLE